MAERNANQHEDEPRLKVGLRSFCCRPPKTSDLACHFLTADDFDVKIGLSDLKDQMNHTLEAIYHILF